MNDLPADAARLLEVARDAMSPTDEDRQRVRRNVLAATAAAVAVGAGAHASASASLGGSSVAAGSTLKVGSGAGALLSGGAKWLLAAALTGTVASASVYTANKHADRVAQQRDMAAAPANSRHAIAARHAQPLAETTHGDSTAAAAANASATVPSAQLDPAAMAPVAAPATPTDAPVPTQAHGRISVPGSMARPLPHRSVHQPHLTAAELATVATTPTAAATAAPQAAASPRIEEELDLVRQASVALREGRAQAALALLREHAARFPSGMLSEERDGLRVLSLCAAGERAEAERAAAIFLARSAHSPLAAHVRKGCPSTP
ncbi:MAG TPA: hypothetical protein VF331_01225 [Polyangiales bacterium]